MPTTEPVGPKGVGTATRPPARILIVEDDAAHAKLTARLVELAGLRVVGSVPTGEAALALASEADVILLDYRLEGPLTGLDVLRELRRRGLPASVVVSTGHGSERVAAEALRLGAEDYVIKDSAFAQLLPPVLGRVLRMREVEHALAEAQEQVIRFERRVAIGEIVVALSHEMNNPLMALRAQLDLLGLDRGALPAQGRAALAAALEQVDRIAALLGRLGELDREAATTYVGRTKMTDLGAR